MMIPRPKHQASALRPISDDQRRALARWVTESHCAPKADRTAVMMLQGRYPAGLLTPDEISALIDSLSL
ncbi:hypothetical protein PMM47T1_21928 [Pseudomonas sp. M47T1]|uniref:hypothetical protein n=1 Tax=Pseudomonas sp. M47T1 TaxID=1179778 RepID=UPI0002607332|nr:hypothetical protein [Pseudomonas sp. M47T1]EIK94408.1 hypothetical protein PMM47T1_21928 [Pseudomonas sp. M47T1]